MIAIVCIVSAAALLLWPTSKPVDPLLVAEQAPKKPKPRSRKEPKS